MNTQIKETLPSYSKNSSFVGLPVEVESIDAINTAYRAVMQRFPYMDHVMLGYRLEMEDGSMNQGGCDDGEHGAGTCISSYLHSINQKNLAVFVVQRYGGINLGMDRFKVIEQTAKSAAYLLRLNEISLDIPVLNLGS